MNSHSSGYQENFICFQFFYSGAYFYLIFVQKNYELMALSIWNSNLLTFV